MPHDCLVWRLLSEIVAENCCAVLYVVLVVFLVHQWLETLRPVTSAQAQVIHQAMIHDFVSGCRLFHCRQSLETLQAIRSAEAEVHRWHLAIICLFFFFLWFFFLFWK